MSRLVLLLNLKNYFKICWNHFCEKISRAKNKSIADCYFSSLLRAKFRELQKAIQLQLLSNLCTQTIRFAPCHVFLFIIFAATFHKKPFYFKSGKRDKFHLYFIILFISKTIVNIIYFLKHPEIVACKRFLKINTANLSSYSILYGTCQGQRTVVK